MPEARAVVVMISRRMRRWLGMSFLVEHEGGVWASAGFGSRREALVAALPHLRSEMFASAAKRVGFCGRWCGTGLSIAWTRESVAHRGWSTMYDSVPSI